VNEVEIQRLRPTRLVRAFIKWQVNDLSGFPKTVESENAHCPPKFRRRTYKVALTVFKARWHQHSGRKASRGKKQDDSAFSLRSLAPRRLQRAHITKRWRRRHRDSP